MSGKPSKGIASFTSSISKLYNLALAKHSRNDAVAFAISVANGNNCLANNCLPKSICCHDADMDRIDMEMHANSTAAADVWGKACPSRTEENRGNKFSTLKPQQSSYQCTKGNTAKLEGFQDLILTAYQDKQARELRDVVVDLFRKQFTPFDRSGRVWKNFDDDRADGVGEGMLGCHHYARNCKFFAECCRMYVSCRLCHDDAVGEDHQMDRFSTKRVLCTLCLTEQDTTCDNDFAFHFCNICKFFENTPGREVYHCPDCGICRRGKGLGIDNFHCNNCDACVTMESKAHHKCLQKGRHASCPVCCADLFTSTRPVVYMRCGHAMHSVCFGQYTQTNYKFPYCSKSLTDMTNYFNRIDDILAQESLPPEHVGKESHILCNDCEQRSTVAFHFLYHKCGAGCNSYNTRVIKVVDSPSSHVMDNP